MKEPISAVTGKPVSQSLYCCLCFKVLKIKECNVLANGMKEDVCKPCAELEKLAKPQ